VAESWLRRRHTANVLIHVGERSAAIDGLNELNTAFRVFRLCFVIMVKGAYSTL